MAEVNVQFDFGFVNLFSDDKEGDTKVCSKCNRDLPVSAYSRHSGRNYPRPECKECNNKLSKLRNELREIHGMPPKGYKCPICGGSEEEMSGQGNKKNGAWVLDHCHEEDKFRGWLCHKCNRGLGCFSDDVNKLKNAISYLNL